MKSLIEYIKEGFDSDNLIWKINIYLKSNKSLKEGFVKLCAKVKSGAKLDSLDIENFEIQYKCKANDLIDFILDNSKKDIDKTGDIVTNLNKIILAILNNRSNNNIINVDVDKYIKDHKDEIVK